MSAVSVSLRNRRFPCSSASSSELREDARRGWKREVRDRSRGGQRRRGRLVLVRGQLCDLSLETDVALDDDDGRYDEPN